MKKILASVLSAMLATTAFAHEGHQHAKGKSISVTGEVVDLTCYMQHPASATGPDHVKCAKSCVAKGLPIGFLAANGTLYMLIGPEHEPVSAQVDDYLGKTSTVSGTMVEHHGIKAITLTSIGGVNAAGKATASASKSKETQVTYTCPMDPEVVSKTPGECPKCGMKLVPVKKDAEKH